MTGHEYIDLFQSLGRILARLFFDPEAFATMYLAALKARVEG